MTRSVKRVNGMKKQRGRGGGRGRGRSAKKPARATRRNTRVSRRARSMRKKAGSRYRRGKRTRKSRRGGGACGTPTTFVGDSWSPEIKAWPGVADAHSGNHYAQNTLNVQPEMSPIDESRTSFMSGGRKRRTKRSKRGGMGGLDIWSQLKTDVSNGFRHFQGEASLPSPLPYRDQMFYGNRAEDNLGYLRQKIN